VFIRKAVLMAIGASLLFAFAVGVGTHQWEKDTSSWLQDLSVGPRDERPRFVSFDGFEQLPPPVARYLRFALEEGQPYYREVRLEQVGTIRGLDSPEGRRQSFEAVEVLSVAPAGFVWDASVRLHRALPRVFGVRVRDAFVGGGGAAEVELLSLLPLASEKGSPELNSGALLRYLAEAVWLPTALLPSSGVRWSPIDESRALAQLRSGDTEVSLEFTFRENGEVAEVFSPGRHRKVGDGYSLDPWRGLHFEYREVSNMRVPMEGEVTWELPQGAVSVWQGRVTDIRYSAAHQHVQ